MTRLQTAFRTESEKGAFTESESFLCKENFFLVAEGLGGDYLAEIARESAKQGISSSFFKHLKKERSPGMAMTSALTEANVELLAESRKIGKKLAASVSAVYISGRIMYFCHLGDSRIYCLQRGEIVQLTRDHTVAEEDRFAEIWGGDPRLLKALTEALGLQEKPDIKVKTFGLRDKDVILMTTEALTRYLSNMQILKLSMKQSSVRRFAARLIEEAQRKGARDPMTLGIIRVREFPLPLGRPLPAAAVVLALALAGGYAITSRGPTGPAEGEVRSTASPPEKTAPKHQAIEAPPAPPKASQDARPAPRETRAAQTDPRSPQPAQPPEASEEMRKKEVPPDQVLRHFLRDWKTAWENTAGQGGNIPAYLSFYSEDFESQGLDRNRWGREKAERNKRKQWIRIELKEISILEATPDNRAEVRFHQDYRSSNFSTATGKSLTLRKGSAGWKIVSEKPL